MPRFASSSDSQSPLSEDTDVPVPFWKRWASQWTSRHEGRSRESSCADTSRGSSVNVRNTRRYQRRHSPQARSKRYKAPTREETKWTRHKMSLRTGHSPQVHPFYLRDPRCPRFADRLAFVAEPSSSTEDSSEDDEIPWARTLCIALLAFCAALLVGAVALVIVSRGPSPAHYSSVTYEHLYRPLAARGNKG
ncbi:uncharacterized protein LOC144130112 [Amblyomma americanum]